MWTNYCLDALIQAMPLFLTYVHIEVRLKLVWCMKWPVLVNIIFLAVLPGKISQNYVWVCLRIDSGRKKIYIILVKSRVCVDSRNNEFWINFMLYWGKGRCIWKVVTKWEFYILECPSYFLAVHRSLANLAGFYMELFMLYALSLCCLQLV